MKKCNLFVIMVIFLMACSEKQELMNTPEELYPVTFSTNLDFTAEDQPLIKSNALSDTVYPSRDSVHYQYFVYTSSGIPVKQKKGYGKEIKDMLPSGLYQIAIIGSPDSDLNNGRYDVVARNFSTDTVIYPKAFYQAFNLSVRPSNDTDTVKNVLLERMWGEIDVEILDRATCYIPSSVQSIGIKTDGVSPTFFMGSKEGHFFSFVNTLTSKTVSDFRRETAFNSLTSYPTQDNRVKVHLVITYNDGTPTKSILLTSVPVKKDVRTTIKGNLGNALQEDQDINLFLQEKWVNEVVTF
ncbi:MAG: hypothetical protein LBQ60_17910 [Bacteroidales bacterium]|nr:hypothetical protein [Bacteroidales bacterium]